jgi:multiple antibiotic resistance protein
MLESAISFGVTTFLSVLPVLNPPEAIPVFIALTAGQPREYRFRMARQTALYVIGIMVVSLLAGRAVLAFFEVGVGHIQVAGGLIVAKTAWEMSTGSLHASPADTVDASNQPDISFSPMALPILSGPGVIALLIATATHSDRPGDYVAAIIALVLLGVLSYLSLRVSGRVSRRLGEKGIDAMTRVMGFIVLAIAVSFVAEGAARLVRQYGF